ncbi:hypothetical protein F01_550053 [Burkholderia cenocepacia]|nr:hypothetical protein F01_550053 [Burkholderia cenocepacia]
MNRDIRDTKQDRAARSNASRHQILDDFVLRIDGDGPPGQRLEVDAPPLSVEREFKAVMQRTFRLHSFTDTGRFKQVHRPLLEYTRPDRRFDLLASAGFEHDGLDTFQMQKMREKEAGRTGANNAYLSAHAISN